MLNIIRKLKHVFTIIEKNIKKEQVEIKSNFYIYIYLSMYNNFHFDIFIVFQYYCSNQFRYF